MATDRQRPDFRVRVGSEQTRAVYDPAPEPIDGLLFVCAHGAGGHMAHRGMLQLTEAFRHRGIPVLRFNFLYREKGSSRPDPMPRLKDTFAAVVAHARQELAPEVLILGGRSMGGRAASMLAAEGFPCDGLLLLAYPLHPAGQPDKLRHAHLPSIQVPVLCLNGTRDSLCRRDLMEKVLKGLKDGWKMHWLEAADHGFHVPKSSGRSDDDVRQEIGEEVRRWTLEVIAAHRRM